MQIDILDIQPKEGDQISVDLLATDQDTAGGGISQYAFNVPATARNRGFFDDWNNPNINAGSAPIGKDFRLRMNEIGRAHV